MLLCLSFSGAGCLVAGSVVAAVVIGVVGRVGCLSLLFMKSLSTASHSDLSSAVVSQVMSLVRSLSSVGSVWSFIDVEVVFPYLGPVFFVSSDLFALGSAVIVVFGNIRACFQ